MEIGVGAVGIFDSDKPENVVVMQIGVSRFCRKTGALVRIGHVVPRAARKMVKMQAVAGEYLASASETCNALWELRGQPEPPCAPQVRLASTARLVVRLAILVVISRTVTATSWMSRLARFTRAVSTYLTEEVVRQPGMLIFTVSVIALAVWMIS